MAYLSVKLAETFPGSVTYCDCENKVLSQKLKTKNIRTNVPSFFDYWFDCISESPLGVLLR